MAEIPRKADATSTSSTKMVDVESLTNIEDVQKALESLSEEEVPHGTRNFFYFIVSLTQLET